MSTADPTPARTSRAKKPATPAPRRRRPAGSKTPTQITAEENEVLDLTIMGFSIRAVGLQMSLPEATVKQRLQSALDRQQSLLAEEYRTITMEQLDYVLSRAMPGVTAGEPKAMSIALQVIDRRAKILGLDAPQRHEHTVQSETDREIKSLLDQIQAGSGDARKALQPIE